jgi:hypothetical protein
MFIGKIVSSSSHVEYICQVYGPGETEITPRAEDYGLSTFVGIEREAVPGAEDAALLVGVIYNTMLMNPEFGNLGPRLSARDELAVFSPDYLAEKVTLVAVIVLGTLDRTGAAAQEVPLIAASLDARVRTLREDEVIAFHRHGAGVRLAYLPMLAMMNSPLSLHLCQHLLAALRRLFPQEAQRLAILGGNLAWKSRVEAVR